MIQTGKKSLFFLWCSLKYNQIIWSKVPYRERRPTIVVKRAMMSYVRDFPEKLWRRLLFQHKMGWNNFWRLILFLCVNVFERDSYTLISLFEHMYNKTSVLLSRGRNYFLCVYMLQKVLIIETKTFLVSSETFSTHCKKQSDFLNDDKRKGCLFSKALSL